MEMNLTHAYIHLLKRVVGSPGCRAENIKLQHIKPEFIRIREIEHLSYLLIDRKARNIFSAYYKPVLNKLVRGEVVLRGTCVESIRYDGVLEVNFKRARIFPTVYCDFIALSMLSQELKASYLDLNFRSLRGDASAPYIKAVIDVLGITSVHPDCEKTIERITKMYYNIVKLKELPRIGHLLKLSAFYFAHVKKLITREEARALYYYLRYENKLDLRPSQGWERGREVYLKLLSRI